MLLQCKLGRAMWGKEAPVKRMSLLRFADSLSTIKPLRKLLLTDFFRSGLVLLKTSGRELCMYSCNQGNGLTAILNNCTLTFFNRR